MDESLRHHNPNPLLRANPISKLFFWWMNPLLKKGYKRQLEVEDMYNVVDDDQSDMLGEQLEQEWKKELERTRGTKKKPSMFRVLWRMFGIQYLLLSLPLLLVETTRVLQPLFLANLIRYFTPDSNITRNECFIYAGCVSLCAMTMSLVHHPYFFLVQRMGMRIRVAFCSLIYRKSLRLSSEGLGKTTTGQIVNLLSNDVNRFDQAVLFLHFLWVAPIEAAIILYFLWQELGPSVLAGVGVLLLLVPFQGMMGKLFAKFRMKTAKYTDERIKLMNEIIAGMRVIKMYCWEKPFGELVKKARRTQHNWNLRIAYLMVPMFMSWTIVQNLTLLSILMFASMISDVPMRPAKLYTLIPYIKLLTDIIGMRLAYFANRLLLEMGVSLKRIMTFLMLDEISDQEQNSIDRPPINQCRMVINNVHAKWDKDVDQSTLDGISAVVEAGKLLAVIGPIGSGKSSLLMAILKELALTKGSISVKGRIAYVAQQPWVFSASVRQNIIFGNKFNKTKYDNILKACALAKDVAMMPHGDMTLIGDRGVSLSGGQRARLSLARALYMEADVYLLDDPLSAVDAAVGKHIYDKVIQGMLKHKPRILVTHQVQFLKQADEIVILKEGSMIGKGNFKDLSKSGIDFSSLLKHDEEDDRPASPTIQQVLQRSLSHDPQTKSHDRVDAQYKSHEHISGSEVRQRLRLDSTCSRHSLYESMLSLDSLGEDYEAEKIQLPEKEERHEGTVGIRVYFEYFKSGASLPMFLICGVLLVATQLIVVTSDYWLAQWSNQEEQSFVARLEADNRARDLNNTNRLLYKNFTDTYGNLSTNGNLTFNGTSMIGEKVVIPTVDRLFKILVYIGCLCGIFTIGSLRALTFFRIALHASRKLHDRMFACLLRSHQRFFDNNPVGRVLNRFSKDIGHIDDMLPITFFDFTQLSLLVIGIVVVAGAVNPWVFIIIAPLIVVFVLIRRYFICTSRNIKRLEGTTRSPVFSHMSATLQGLHTIRAFGVEGKFVAEFDAHQNLHTESFFLFLASSRWLAVRLDWICVLFITSVSFLCVLAADTMNAGLVGLSITYAMSMMGMFQWGVRQSTEVENQMISVERVLDYTKLEPEADLESKPDKKPPPEWPLYGEITAENANLQYTPDGPIVLKNLNFDIHAQEKVGIVGRTGAGKSSLISMLFRLAEPQGRICIDKINILSLGLHDLRKHISIIPQDPVLFTGTLRRNLDPFTNHPDAALWRSLEEVQLKQSIEDLPQGIDSVVSEGGINFSVGQRQLICLARAILRNNRILMIDEATANVDPRTDSLIQETIREKFKSCTVLTIAHRLHTIMDSDRILVLDEGKILEFDKPYLLLQKPEGILRQLVEQTGRSETANLIGIAKTAYDKIDKSRKTRTVVVGSQHLLTTTIEEDAANGSGDSGNGTVDQTKDDNSERTGESNAGSDSKQESKSKDKDDDDVDDEQSKLLPDKEEGKNSAITLTGIQN